jgi:murein DD-endopeptidase MepM/ murein hydrolase activator NlpD
MNSVVRGALLAWLLAHGLATTPYTWGPGLIAGGGWPADGGPLGDVGVEPADAAPADPRGASAAPSNAIFKFFPQAGTLWQDLFIGNYVDVDPTAGVLDFECNARAYNGHNGHDVSINSFQYQAIGVPVFAVQDGTVTLATDGNPDQNTQALGQPDNTVRIDHGGGLETRYHHMKNGSIAVSVGQQVVAGQQIGSTASAGNSTYPHLHFGTYQDGVLFEPSSGACRPGPSNWVSQVPTFTEPRMLDFTFGTSAFTGDRAFPFDNVVRQGSFVNTGVVQTVHLRLRIMNWPATPAVNWVFRRPDGTTAVNYNGSTAGGPYNSAHWGYNFNVNFNQNGTWLVELSLNGTLRAVMPLTVGPAIVNRAPLPASVTLDPVNPGPDDVTFCRVTPWAVHRQDPDYDIVRYRFDWTVNGVPVRTSTNAALSDALRKGMVQPGDTVRCTITPNDGQMDGPSATTSNLRDVNLLTNGDFSNGTTGWAQFASPDLSYIQSSVSGGVFDYYRAAGGTSAVVLQQTNASIPAGGRVAATFKYGNSGTERKRFSVLIHDGDFSDLSVCTFWTEPGQALTTYQMVTRATKAWNHATISLYAASTGSATEFNRLDDVSLVHASGAPVLQTECHDPNRPTPPGGADGAEMLVNGDFSAGLPPWQTVYSTITAQVSGGVAEFYRSPGAQGGVLLQNNLPAVSAGEIVTTTFQMGNSSQWRQRVTLLVQDAGWSDLHACTFWMPPGQPLQTYTIVTYATRNWPQAMISIYPSTTGYAPGHQWLRLDNASMKKTPGAALLGTGCYEPGSVLPLAQQTMAIASSLPGTSAVSWSAQGFTSTGGSVGSGDETWTIEGATAATGRLSATVDLRGAASAQLTFESWLSGALGAVQVSADGATWTTVADVPVTEGWQALSADLTPFAGQVVWVRFAFESSNGAGAWRLRGLQVGAWRPNVGSLRIPRAAAGATARARK